MSAGPQQREFLKEIPRAKQVGVRGPSKEIFNKKIYKLSKLGCNKFWKILFLPHSLLTKVNWSETTFNLIAISLQLFFIFV
ncbi:hypothetical protein HMPREF2564_02700 [Staphylococcus sp. HMSC068D03]|nr:hypothetical protein HMPREF2564_02700 [Staphylococcus sp. HMSC068D03]